jgi:hypothetical protein
VAEIEAVLPPLKIAADLYAASSVLAVASNSTKEDAVQADRSALRAIELLRLAFAKGYTDVGTMQRQTDFDPLRSRLDYLDLLWDLANRSAPNPSPRS